MTSPRIPQPRHEPLRGLEAQGASPRRAPTHSVPGTRTDTGYLGGDSGPLSVAAVATPASPSARQAAGSPGGNLGETTIGLGKSPATFDDQSESEIDGGGDEEWGAFEDPPAIPDTAGPVPADRQTPSPVAPTASAPKSSAVEAPDGAENTFDLLSMTLQGLGLSQKPTAVGAAGEPDSAESRSRASSAAVIKGIRPELSGTGRQLVATAFQKAMESTPNSISVRLVNGIPDLANFMHRSVSTARGNVPASPTLTIHPLTVVAHTPPTGHCDSARDQPPQGSRFRA